MGLLGFCQAQKSSKQGHHGHRNGANQYAQNPYQGNNYNQHGGGHAPKAKPTYPLLLSDSRTLNSDGTINFQYAADNGLQQGETVDADGTRRGFYSYPGPDGKPITVKYTAGKNGFIAEGDHLPKQPNVPGHSENDEIAAHKYSPRGQSPPAYRPRQHQPSYHGGNQGQYNHQPFPQRPSYSPAGHSQYNSGPSHLGGHRPRPIHSSPQIPSHQGFDFGPVNYGAPSHTSVNRYKGPPIPQVPQRSYSGISSSAPHAAPAGPYNGQYDLGNGGQFSINFNPGQSRQVAVGGDYGRFPQ